MKIRTIAKDKAKRLSTIIVTAKLEHGKLEEQYEAIEKSKNISITILIKVNNLSINIIFVGCTFSNWKDIFRFTRFSLYSFATTIEV